MIANKAAAVDAAAVPAFHIGNSLRRTTAQRR